MFASLTSEHKFGQIINWNKGKEILDMKAIMTVTCFMGKNTKSVSPSTHKKGKKKESKLGLQGPAVSTHQHVRQPHILLLGLKDTHSRKTPSPLGPLTACPFCPLPHPGSHAIFFLRVSLVGSHSSKSCHQLSAVRGGLHGHRSCHLLVWVSAQILPSTLGDSYQE